MAYTTDILNVKKVADNGLLSKIQIGGKTYEIKDLIARENIGTLSAGLDAIAADLAALSYVKATGVYADDAAIQKAINDKDAAMKSYVDAQVGSINKFDMHVLAADEALPTASEETMFILYLKPESDAASGAYVEYITVKNGEEYKWEAIGSTKMDVTGFVTEDALNDTLKSYQTIEQAGIDHKALEDAYKAADKAITDNLGALAAKDSASGTVAGQTISGVKANGQSAGSITVELEQSEHAMNSTGKYTPAGNVAGSVTVASHNVPVALNHSTESASLTKGDYTPAGDVSVALSGATFNAITGVGTQASFKEGAFTAATLDSTDVTANYAKEGIVGSVNDDECLVFTAAGIEAITATKVNAFNGGSKAADEFVANSLPTMAEQTVGVQSASFTGTKASELIVTGVSYSKATDGNGTCAGGTYDINASFTGTEGDIAVAGLCHDYTVKTAQFNPAAIEVAVGDIVIADKAVTVE